MDNILNEVKLSLGLSSSDKDGLLTSLITRSSQQVNNYIKQVELPVELIYIVVELAIARYNRIGSEGLNSENTDGVSFSYKSNILNDYKSDLDEWISKNKPKNNKTKVRLI